MIMMRKFQYELRNKKKIRKPLEKQQNLHLVCYGAAVENQKKKKKNRIKETSHTFTLL